MGKATVGAVVLDAGALIAFEKGNPRMRALCREALRTRTRLVIPAGALAQVWRDPARQVTLRALLTGVIIEVHPIDRLLAQAVGILCGRTGTSDVVDASVVLTARREHATVVTSDPDDMCRLDPDLAVERI